MPAVLTHKAIMLLARERIQEMRDRLQAKVDRGDRVTDLEHRVLYLAKKAYEMMTEDEASRPSIEYPEGDVYTRPLGLGVSRFSVMGSMGPDITGFSAMFLKSREGVNQAWVFDTIHKGNPDHEKEPVIARTTDLSLEIWRQAQDSIRARTGDGDDFEAKKALALRRMRAYTLGHLCHVAGDVLSHPFVNDVEWHLGVREEPAKREVFGHQATELNIEPQVARRIFLREGLREGGQEWTVWWPGVDEVPPEFFEAYADAFRFVYFDDGWPEGFGKFEAERGSGRPELSAGLIKDGYSFYKNGVLTMGYGWGWWSWWGYLVPLTVPALLMFPLLPAMPKGRQFLDRAPWDVDERGWFEMLSLPLFLGAVPSLFYGIWLATISTHGVEADVITGLITAGVGFVLGIIALATVGVDDLSPELRWGLIWLVPFLGGLYQSVRASVELGLKDKPHFALFAIYALPMAFMLIMLVLLGLVGMGITKIVSLIDEDAEGTSSAVVYGVFTALVIIGVLIAWFWLPSILRDALLLEEPEDFPTTRRHHVRVFDDATLVHPASVTDPDLSERLYPSETRELLKLWWEGDGEMHIRSRRTHLEFSFDGEGAADQIVPAPMTLVTAEEYGASLRATVKAADGTTGHLGFAPVYGSEPEGEQVVYLPPGATFADEGDVGGDGKPITVLEDRLERTAHYAQLEAEEADTNYVLRHAPRLAQALRVGRNGSIAFDPREAGAFVGVGTIQSSGRDVTGADTDFSAFLDVGDRIEAADQIRTVTLIRSATDLEVSSEFNPALPAGTPFKRLGETDEPDTGFDYVTEPALSVVGGDRIMDRAADLAALLCLGATPHLLPDTELDVDTLADRTFEGGGDVPTAVTPVQQVFRNWSLDRRRENEWRMLVSGGAFDEKGGDPASYDAAMSDPRPASWTPPTAPVTGGEPLTRELGWVPVLRQWIDMASPEAADAASSAGSGITNQQLSRAMAYLLDMPDPRVLAES